MKKFKVLLLNLFLLFVFCNYLFANYSNLKEAVNDTTEIRSYSLSENEIVTEDLGQLCGTQLTIFGNGYGILANEATGITISEGQTLNIEEINEITGFNSEQAVAIFSNGGTVNIKSSSITLTDNKIAIKATENGIINIGNNVDRTSMTIEGTKTEKGIMADIANNGKVTITDSKIFIKGVKEIGIDGAIIQDSYIKISDVQGIGASNINKEGVYPLVLENNNIGLKGTSSTTTVVYGGDIKATDNNIGIDGTEGNVLLQNLTLNIEGKGKKSESYGIQGERVTIKNISILTIKNNYVGIEGAILNDVGIIRALISSNTIGLKDINMKDTYINIENNNTGIFGGTIENTNMFVGNGTIGITGDVTMTNTDILIMNNQTGIELNNNILTMQSVNMNLKNNGFGATDRIGIKATNNSTINLTSMTIINEGNDMVWLYGNSNLNITKSTITLNKTAVVDGLSEPIISTGIVVKNGNNEINFKDTFAIFNGEEIGTLINVESEATVNITVDNSEIEGTIIGEGTKNLILKNNSTWNILNNKIQQHNFKTISVTDTLNLSVDVDLINKQMDTITTDNYDGTGKININEINILTDIKQEKVSITFTTSTALKENITSVNTANSKVFKYDVEYNKNLGNLIFSLTKDINFTVIESQVANSVGGFVTQTTIFNQAFASMENIKSRILQVKNKISDESPLYASTANTIFFQKTNRIESGLWLRPFYSQETINLDNLSIDNTLTGTLAGLDLATGENSLVSLYLGYAGSEQKYENIKVSQTGYILGVTGMLVKEQWYAGVTANINFNKAESQSSYGTDNFDMNMYSVGAKAGYNFDLSDKWILEPNLMLMYGNVNSQEYQTTQGAKVSGQSVANIIFEPQVKAKLNLENGWQPYGLIGYVINAGDKVTTKVEEVEFDGKKIGNYVEFGAGIDKSFKNSPWSLYIQLTGRSGDRTGFDGNFGIKYSFLTAKEKKKISKIKKIEKRRAEKKRALEEERKEQKRIEREKKKAELKEQQEIEEENKRIQQEEQEKHRRIEIQRRIKANYEE